MNNLATQTTSINQFERLLDSLESIRDSVAGLESYKNFTEDVIMHLVEETESQDQLEHADETSYTDSKKDIPIIYPKPVSRQKDVFISLQEWEGTVEEVKEGSFVAKLIDLTNDTPDEIAEIPLEEVSEDDYPLIKTGAIFYWNIGYLNKTSGQRERTTFIRFRRLPLWQKGEIDTARKKAEKLHELFG